MDEPSKETHERKDILRKIDDYAYNIWKLSNLRQDKTFRKIRDLANEICETIDTDI